MLHEAGWQKRGTLPYNALKSSCLDLSQCLTLYQQCLLRNMTFKARSQTKLGSPAISGTSPFTGCLAFLLQVVISKFWQWCYARTCRSVEMVQ